MGLIYLPKIDFSLERQKSFSPVLESAGISKEDYNTHIKPILDSLHGIYYSKDP